MCLTLKHVWTQVVTIVKNRNVAIIYQLVCMLSCLMPTVRFKLTCHWSPALMLQHYIYICLKSPAKALTQKDRQRHNLQGLNHRHHRKPNIEWVKGRRWDGAKQNNRKRSSLFYEIRSELRCPVRFYKNTNSSVHPLDSLYLCVQTIKSENVLEKKGHHPPTQTPVRMTNRL